MRRYFEDYVEYPRDIVEDILPLNTLWEYISTTFLNAFINYVDIKCAFVHARYNKWGDVMAHTVSIMDPPQSFKWVKFTGTKQELFDRLTEDGAVFHPKLDSDFQDDVLVLGKKGDTWVFFWFDRDCSDSNIGRFQTDDPDEVVIQNFKDYVMSLSGELGDDEIPKEILLHYFRGWIAS